MNLRKKLFFAALVLFLLFAIFFTINYYTKKNIYDNINALRSGSDEIRDEAVEKLVKTGKSAVEPMLFALRFDPADAKSSFAGFFAGKFHNDVIAGYANYSKEESTRLKSGILYALSRMGDRRAVMPAISCIKQGDSVVRSEAFTTLIKLGNLPVKPLMELTLDKDPEVRKYAALLLGDTKSAEAVEPLIRLLDDGDDDVIEATVIALGRVGSPAYDALIKCLDDKSESVKMAAFKALGRSSDPRAIAILLKPEEHEELVRKIFDDENYNVSYAYIKGSDAVEPLLKFLNGAGRKQKLRVINCLGKIPDRRAIKMMVELAQDSDREIRIETLKNFEWDYRNLSSMHSIQCTRLLSSVNYWKYFDENKMDCCLIEASALSPLVEMLTDKDEEIRSGVKETLTRLESGFSSLRCSFSENHEREQQNSHVRRFVEYLLKEHQDYEDLLVEKLKDKDPKMRAGCAEILGAFCDKRVEPNLLILLKDEHPAVRASATSALRFSDNPEVLQEVTYLLRDKSDSVVHASINSLYGKDLNCLKDIKPILECKIYKSEVIPLLGMSPNPVAVDELLEYLQSNNPNYKKKAIAALRQLGDEKAAPLLQEVMNGDNRDGPRKDIIYALGQIGGVKSVDVLINLNSKNETLKNEITYALLSVGEPARPQLERALKNKDLRIRDGAKEVLRMLDEKR